MFVFFFLMIRLLPSSTLFPYTTLFRSFFAKLTISYKEARETKYWIRLLRDAQYIEPTISQELLYDIEEILRIIGSIQKRSEEHTSELQSRPHLVCRLLLEKKKKNKKKI